MARTSKYTKDVVTKMCKGMSKRSELQKENASAYAAARREGWLDEIFGPSTRGAPAKEAPKGKKAAPRTKKVAPKATKPVTGVVQISGISTFAQAKEVMDLADKLGAEATVVFDDEEVDVAA